MPKHAKKKANKNKARKGGNVHKRDLPFAGESQVYAKITKSLGERRFKLVCSDGLERIGKLRGKVRKSKRSWVAVGSWVIAALRDFQAAKADIVEILSYEEIKLDAYGEISLKNLEEEVEENGFYFSEGEGGEEINIDEI